MRFTRKELSELIETVLHEKFANSVPQSSETNSAETSVDRDLEDIFTWAQAECSNVEEQQGEADRENAQAFGQLAKRAERNKRWLMKHGGNNGMAFLPIANLLADLAKATSFWNRPSFFQKGKHKQEMLSKCAELRKLIEQYRKRALDNAADVFRTRQTGFVKFR